MSSLHKLDLPEISSVLFHPQGTTKSEPPAGAINIDIPVTGGDSIGGRLFTAANDDPVILYFHGNGEIVADHDDLGPVYTGLGINFLVVDYRGYGWSTGEPTATRLIEDGQTIFEFVSTWLASNNYTGKLFVMGRSMGSAPAIDLASQHSEELGGLILESSFAETVPLALTLGIDLAALGIDEDDCFNNLEKISEVTTPTFMLHGQQDSLIPLWHAHKLHADCGAKSKELQIIPGADHNSMIVVAGMLYFQAIKAYIDKVTGVAEDWREKRRKFREQREK